jgi:hypothetical protein
MEPELWNQYVRLSQEQQLLICYLHGWKRKQEFKPSELGRIGTMNALPTIHRAWAIFLTVSYINHSCRYNAEYHYHLTSNEATIHLVSDISAGDEITITYVKVERPALDRNRDLMERYRFECECEACINNDETDYIRFLINSARLSRPKSESQLKPMLASTLQRIQSFAQAGIISGDELEKT